MSETFETLKVTQIGGFAGNIAMPPLVDLKRGDLDEAGRKALDAAGAQLADAAAAAGEAPALGADLAGYRVEISGGDGGSTRQFTLPGTGGTNEGVASADVPTILASLLEAVKATS